MVRERIGPVAAFKTAGVIGRLPKTHSGKILRRTIKSIAEDTPYRVPATIDDPSVLSAVRATMLALGYAGRAPEDETASG